MELWREILVDKAKQNRDQTVIDRPNEDELRKLTEIGSLIATSLSTDEAFEEFARLAKSLVPHDRLALAALTPDFNHVDSVFVSGIELDQPNASQRMIIPQGRIRHQMFVDFQQYHAVDDELNELTELVDDEKYRIAAGLRSVLSTPLIWNGEPQGVMTLRSSKWPEVSYRSIVLSSPYSTKTQVESQTYLLTVSRSKKRGSALRIRSTRVTYRQV